MATNYITLTGAWNLNGGGTLSVVARIDVPATGTNSAGIQWRTAVAQERANGENAGTTSWPGGSMVELDDGSKSELTFGYRTSIGRPVIAELEARIASEASDYGVRLQQRLEYWGKEGSV
jgi:hypothetical protein